MYIFQPGYYDDFRCIADRCPDSCCKEWEVQVDDRSAAYYLTLPGALGEDLRRFLRQEDGGYCMTITDSRCPMWRQDGLCRIQAELGEDALCQTCRDFPRLRHDYGDFQEWGLELSCPEAARLILNTPGQPLLRRQLPGAEEGDYDREAMAVLRTTRETLHSILSDTGRPMGQTLALVLLYGCQAQGELDGEPIAPFDPEAALEAAREFAGNGSPEEILNAFLELEILTPEWEQRLRSPRPGPWDRRTLALARYLADRYWLQAVSDYDLYSRVKFLVTACLAVKILGGDFLRTAQLFSKEVENNLDNVEALLDAAYSGPTFTDGKLLDLLLR